MTDNEDRARTEIEDLHVFLEEWLTGRATRDDADYDIRFTDRFTDDFLMIPPGGAAVGRDDVLHGLRGAHGASPDLRIRIRNTALVDARDGLVVATYEEHQRGARRAIAPDNARRSTVVFVEDADRPGRLLWRLLHETWLPDDELAALAFDF